MKKLLLVVCVGLLVAAEPPKAEDAAAKELEKLQGSWTMAALEINGKPESDERIKEVTLVVKKDRYLLTTRGKTFEMILTLDPSKKPMAMDMVFTEGPEKDKVHRGIFMLEGDTLKICRARLPEKDRPTDFGTWPDSDSFLVVWKRQKQ